MNNQLQGHISKIMDFSNPQDAKEVLESFGGEELLKTKFPKVYDSFLRTVEKHKNEKLLNNMSQSNDNGFKSEAFAGAITIGKNKLNGKKTILTATEEGQISGITCVQGKEKWSRAYITSQMKNITNGVEKARVIKTSSVLIAHENNYSQVQEKKLTDIISFSRQKIQNTIKSKAILKGDGTMEVMEASSDIFTTEDCVTPVENIEIYAPRSYKSNNPILMMYNRTPDGDEVADYSYPENKLIVGTHKVETWFPIKGKIKFVNGFKPLRFSLESKGNKPQLQYKGEGVCDYNYKFKEIASCFKVSESDSQVMEFELKLDWKNKLDITAYTTDHKANIGLHFFFYITAEIEGFKEEEEIGIVISTVNSLSSGEEYYITKYGENAYLPYTFIKWGCFGKNTKIQMADKSFKLVSELKKGDKLLGEDDKVLNIKDMVSGDEEIIFCIKTKGNKKIHVSGTHPILTSNGGMRAQDIKAKMKLICADGSEDEVEFNYTKKYNDKVYNIVTDGSDWVLADGIWAGNFDLQNDNKVMAKEEEAMSEDVLQISEEFTLLMKHLNTK